MIYGAAVAAMAPEPKIFDKGLVFVKDTDILLSGDKWTIVVNIALDDFATLVDTMKSVLSHFRQKIHVQQNPKSYSFDIHWGEINQLDKMVGELEVDLRSFQRLLFEEILVQNPRTISVRDKRGLIDILGYGMKYLFGILSSGISVVYTNNDKK
jgi:hypothetical protein